MSSKVVYKLENVEKEYSNGDVTVKAIRRVSFEVSEGEIIVIMGPSGSGKSTLLNLMSGLDSPTYGKVFFNNTDISRFDEDRLTDFRCKKIGIVFQFYNLIPVLTAKENVEMATEVSGVSVKIEELFEKVGLLGREKSFPCQLSGGEQQRVAIARAVAKNPEVLLCDEPTGALDFETGILVLKLLKELNQTNGKPIIIITHNQPIAQMAHKVITIRSGEITMITRNDNPVDPERIQWG